MQRGMRPNPAHLRMIGTVTAKAVPVDPQKEIDPGFTNGLKPPCKLTKKEQEVWDNYISKAPWLTPFDDTKALMWVRLRLEYLKDGDAFTAGKLGHFRALGSELGFDPSSRTRFKIPKHAKTKASKYFAPEGEGTE